jgi:hypothetical protein
MPRSSSGSSKAAKFRAFRNDGLRITAHTPGAVSRAATLRETGRSAIGSGRLTHGRIVLGDQEFAQASFPDVRETLATRWARRVDTQPHHGFPEFVKHDLIPGSRGGFAAVMVSMRGGQRPARPAQPPMWVPWSRACVTGRRPARASGAIARLQVSGNPIAGRATPRNDAGRRIWFASSRPSRGGRQPVVRGTTNSGVNLDPGVLNTDNRLFLPGQGRVRQSLGQSRSARHEGPARDSP